MLYPGYVHIGDATHAHGVALPDLPGCHAAADEWCQLPAAVQEAVEAHCHGGLEVVAPPTSIETLAAVPDYQGGVWMLFEVDMTRIAMHAESRPASAQ